MAEPNAANPTLFSLATPVDPARELPLNVTQEDSATAWTLAAAVAGVVHRVTRLRVEVPVGSTWALYSDSTLIYGPFSKDSVEAYQKICETAAGAALKLLVTGVSCTLAGQYIEV